MAKDPAVGAGQPTDGGDDGSPDAIRTSGGPFAVQFPPDLPVWTEARKLVSDKNTRVEDLATICLQDPVIVIELLRVSNAMFFSGGRSPITSVRTAIIRLGSDVVLEHLDKLQDRVPFEAEDVQHWFEVHRSRCKRTAILARILAEAQARQLADDCQAAGLLMHIGDMLAVAYFKEEYVKLSEEHSRSGLNFRLTQDKKFDVERMGLTYLRRSGIPEALLFAIDREARAPRPDRAPMKPLCFSASEMVEAFDANRWDKLAPGKTLPPKSAVRTLSLSDPQYLKIYERASEYLFSARLAEERKKQGLPPEGPPAETLATTPSSVVATEEDSGFESEISNLIHNRSESSENDSEADEAPTAPTPQAKQETKVSSVPSALDSANDPFSLMVSRAERKTVPRVTRSEPAMKPPPLHTAKGTAVVNDITSGFEKASTSEELLAALLETLVDRGPFEKSALIVVSKDRKNAVVVAARGPGIGNGQKLSLDDPLSPLAQCFSRVRSFTTAEKGCSPWGSKAYALSPIDADHSTPVALYADCGNDGALTFEARRVFRSVVAMLNQKLPTIPGGIPVELRT